MATQASDSIKQRPRTTIADELAVVVQRAQAFTNASGAAIAIGNTEELVCRARSGSSAPEVGTAMRVEGSFTGICIHSGKELRCDDAETDTRVDTAALRSLGIRSLVVTPIKDEGKVIGVLAVFAPTPHAFTITHVAVLKTMADQISALLQKERRSPREEAHLETPVALPKPAAPAPLPPVVIRPAASSATIGAAAAPARTNGSSAPVVEPLRPVAIATEIVPVPFPKREEKREAKRPEPKHEPTPAPRNNFAVLDAVAGEPQRSKSGKFVLLGGLVVVAAAAVAVWMFVAKHKTNSVQTQQPVQSAQTAAPVPQPTVAATPSPAATSTPATPSDTAPVAAPSTKHATEKPESKKTDSQKNDKQNKPAPAPATVELVSGPSKINNTGQAQSPSADVAPSLMVGSSSSPSLNSLAKPVSNSAPSIMTQSELVNAKVIRGVPAVYPEIAKARRITGTAVVRVTVGKDGRVTNPKFVSGPVVFRDAAFDAVKQWLFKPATLNGQAIEQETEITVKFSSPN